MWNRYIPHAPTPKQQAALLCHHIRELFYGGAAGGGKSDWLLMEGLQYVHVPGYAALILRRTFQDLALPGALLDRSHEWLERTDARWNDRDKRWTFPNGSTLSFGFLEHENDKYRYQSSEFQFIGFDELTQFTETQYRYLFTRLRRALGSEVPLRMRAASNPGGSGHEWVKGRFVGGRDEAGVFRAICPVTKDGRIVRAFIPSTLRDNPFLDQEEYVASLEETDATTLQQMLEGNWEATPEGRKFKREWLEGRVLQAPPDPSQLVKVARYWDLAATEPKKGRDPDFTRGVKIALTRDKRLVVLDGRGLRSTPAVVKSFIRATAESDGRHVRIGIEQEGGSAAVSLMEDYKRLLLGYQFAPNRETGAKELRFNPFSSAAQNGLVYVVWWPGMEEWLLELEAFPNPAWHDDYVDATSGAAQMLVGRKSGSPGVRVI